MANRTVLTGELLIRMRDAIDLSVCRIDDLGNALGILPGQVRNYVINADQGGNRGDAVLRIFHAWKDSNGSDQNQASKLWEILNNVEGAIEAANILDKELFPKTPALPPGEMTDGASNVQSEKDGEIQERLDALGDRNSGNTTGIVKRKQRAVPEQNIQKPQTASSSKGNLLSSSSDLMAPLTASLLVMAVVLYYTVPRFTFLTMTALVCLIFLIFGVIKYLGN